MPRTLPAALTTAMDSGIYEPYIRVKLNANPNDTGAVTFETDFFKLESLKAQVKVYNPTGLDNSFFSIVRGAVISGAPSTISSIWFRTVLSENDGKFETLYGEPLQKNYQSIAANSTYQTVIETALISLEPYTIVPSYEGTATWKTYQFYPTGKNIILSPRKKLFTLLQQKYLIFAVEDGWDGANNNIFFFVATDARATDYTITDLLFTITPISSESRKIIARDENNTIRTNGSATDPIHNLGFLLSTASLPTNAATLYIGAHTSKIPVHLKYRTGDKAVLVGNNVSTSALRIKVTEILDTKSTPSWYQIIEPIAWYGSTEGGPLPATIEAAAPYTPLATGNFDGVLSSNDNNVQAAMETIDDMLAGSFSLTGDITPSTIASNQNDYNPTGLSNATVLRLETTSADLVISGLAGGADGRIIIIHNIGATNTFYLSSEDPASLAANRFALDRSIMLTPNSAISLIYDATSSRWRAILPRPNTFSDGEGAPAFLTGTSNVDGTSAYTARRDHAHQGFNDTEGDPAAIGTAADGTSTYAARRDHVHAITNGESVLGAAFTITGTAGTFQDTGLNVTLPSAGTYRIVANVRAALNANDGAGTTAWWISAQLYNTTDAAAITNSERLVVLTGVNAQLFQMTCPIDIIVTVAASKTIRLEAARNGNGTPAWTTTTIESNSAGRTILSYEKIA